MLNRAQPAPPAAPVAKSNTLNWVLGAVLGMLALFALAGWLMVNNYAYVTAMVPIRLDPARLPHLAESEARLKAAATPYDRWVLLGYAGIWALHQGRTDDAAAFGNELLDGIEKFPQDWNVGNAIHQGNSLLGRVALRRGDIGEAKSRLLAAGRTPGSPQLNSFGPGMALADDLLQRGEKQVVLEYFDLCEKFWKMDNGSLAAWRMMVRNDRVPAFGAHLLR